MSDLTNVRIRTWGKEYAMDHDFVIRQRFIDTIFFW
jgi:hypothetical protein